MAQEEVVLLAPRQSDFGHAAGRHEADVPQVAVRGQLIERHDSKECKDGHAECNDKCSELIFRDDAQHNCCEP